MPSESKHCEAYRVIVYDVQWHITGAMYYIVSTGLPIIVSIEAQIYNA